MRPIFSTCTLEESNTEDKYNKVTSTLMDKYNQKVKFNVENECSSSLSPNQIVSEKSENCASSTSSENLTEFEFEEAELSWYEECQLENDKMLSSTSPSSPISPSTSPSSPCSSTKTQILMPFQVQNGKSRKRVCTLKPPVKRIQNSGQSLLAGQVEFCDPQKLLDTTHLALRRLVICQ